MTPASPLLRLPKLVENPPRTSKVGHRARSWGEVLIHGVLASGGYDKILGDESGSEKSSSNGKASSLSRSVSDRAAAFGADRREARLGTLGTPPGRGHRPVVPLEQGAGAAVRREDGELVDARGRQVAGLRGVDRRVRRAGRAVLGRRRGRGVRGDRLGVAPGSLGPRVRHRDRPRRPRSRLLGPRRRGGRRLHRGPQRAFAGGDGAPGDELRPPGPATGVCRRIFRDTGGRALRALPDHPRRPRPLVTGESVSVAYPLFTEVRGTSILGSSYPVCCITHPYRPRST